MCHPPTIWTDPFNAEYPLAELRASYAEYLAGRSRAASPGTINMYGRALVSFEKSLMVHGDRSCSPACRSALH